MYINEITDFLAWCTLLNLGIYLFSALFLLGFKNFTMNIHSKISGIAPNALPKLYFKFLGNYKIGIFLFNIVPYIALRLMA
ncbi:DUF6868 family protein [Thalassotalea profundi]|uniref:DUF6868 domain-containing protein n=1 Tax=Thalassotalea profundi TaxID=2036687 RepID=A0ABQ3IKL8_9GAMM|nr:hypothetical protein GCM10011501_15800 [Thalassotalea profundi]